MGIREDYEDLKQRVEKEDSVKVKIALFGQPGAGKSSLINAIIGDEVAEVGQKNDVTTKAQIYEHKDLIFVDLPGYGTTEFPANKWFSEFNSEEYDMFLCTFSGKFNESDTEFFKELQAQNRKCIFVRTKSDEIWEPGKNIQDLKTDIINNVQHQINSTVKVHFVSRRTNEGILELVDAIATGTEPAKRDKFIRSIKARTERHLTEKRNACERLVIQYAGLAAGNALNPIPGMDISIDVGIMLRLFMKIRDSYGLDERELEYLAPFVPFASRILEFTTKEGVFILLKKFASQQVVKEIAKYIPFIGQVIASSLGFAITKAAGDAYVNDCHEVAKKIMQENIDFSGEVACGRPL